MIPLRGVVSPRFISWRGGRLMTVFPIEAKDPSYIFCYYVSIGFDAAWAVYVELRESVYGVD